MTSRERFLRVLNYEPVDRPPFYEYGAYPLTIQRWQQEGLAPNLHWPNHKPHYAIEQPVPVLFNLSPIPPFEEEILEEDEQYEVKRQRNGIVTRALKEGTIGEFRACMDQYLDWPVHNLEDFNLLKSRYDPHLPERLPKGWPDKALELQKSEAPLFLYSSGEPFGLYMQLRSWMGTEPLSCAFYDQPGLVHEMLQFLTDFSLSLMDKILNVIQPDYVAFDEDLAYKTGLLFSPAHFREFFAPYYRRIIARCRAAGVKFFQMDSDGNPKGLIPDFLEIGINWIRPCEAAAGVDVVKLRKEFGRDLVLSGGIDKREVSKGAAAIEKELCYKIPALVEEGGYIPHLDHLFYHDCPYEHALYYLDFKARLMEGREGA